MTYKLPSAKVNINPSFCFGGRFKDLRSGIGIKMMTKSLKMLKLAWKNHRVVLSTQVAPASPVQNARTGTHKKIELRTQVIPYARVIAIVVQQIRVIHFPTNIRLYCRRIDSLLHVEAIL